MLTKYEIMKEDIKKKVRFFSPEFNLPLRDRTKFKYFAAFVLKKEGLMLNLVNFIFCSDKDLLKLNNHFLKHDYYTDILTFSLSEIRNEVAADIYISLERTKENSVSFNVSHSKELHRVMIHGLLHLCGYKDKSKKEITAMKEREDFYLNIYFK